jgi:hypothetical protein
MLVGRRGVPAPGATPRLGEPASTSQTSAAPGQDQSVLGVTIRDRSGFAARPARLDGLLVALERRVAEIALGVG